MTDTTGTVEYFPHRPIPPAKKRHGPRVFGETRKRARNRLNITIVNEALTNNRGLLRETALDLGVSRHALREYISDHTACATVAKETREAMGDVAEKKLFDLIEAGDVKCIIYYLSTVHRNRGYGLGKNQSLFDNSKVHVDTIQIVAIPSGQFLAPDDKPIDAIEYAEQVSAPDYEPDVLK